MSDGARKNSTREEQRANELQQAVARFEEAVQELARGAANDLADRATGLIDETTARLRNVGTGEERDGSRQAGGEPRNTYSWRYGARANRLGEEDVPSEGLYRDKANGRIAGVCAGIARYFGVETWVARLGGITGLLFLPAVVFPAYWIAYLLMDDDPRAPGRSRRRRSKRSRRRERNAQAASTPSAEPSAAGLTPRRLLRHVTADLNAAELRLRRMEGHVTSSQYELRRELHALDT